VSDDGARLWWVFLLPESIAHVPAESEAKARDVLRHHSYDHAPVEAWRCLGTKRCPRYRVHEAILFPLGPC
jgi:hypothetical protein